jgi:hypothetical protein
LIDYFSIFLKLDLEGLVGLIKFLIICAK